MTLVVNLFGGPGTGKSTTASLVFGQLKSEGIRTELVHGFAKDLTWEKREEALRYQPYIFGKQSYHVHRLLGKADVIVTDSPILLSSHIYSRHTFGAQRSALRALGIATWNEWDTLSVFLQRNKALHPFVQAGRNQNEEESTNLDQAIRGMLDELQVTYYSVLVGPTAAQLVSSLVHEELNRK